MMEFIKCDDKYFSAASDLYHRVVTELRQTVNYPKWGVHHPSDEDLRSALEAGSLYVCLDNGDVAGAVVLNEEPTGDYEAGDWAVDLERGEYLVIHLLTTDFRRRNTGIGGFIIDKCIEAARQGGYKAVRLDVVPGNKPAVDLYLSKGFTYAGTKDLKLNVKAIPVLSLYEKNL